jgi:hypothetical protein
MKLPAELKAISDEWVRNCDVFDRTNICRTAYVVYRADDEYGSRCFRRLFFNLHEALDYAKQYASEINFGTEYSEFVWDVSSFSDDDTFLSIRAGGYEYTDVNIVVCSEIRGEVSEHTASLFAYDSRDWSVRK